MGLILTDTPVAKPSTPPNLKLPPKKKKKAKIESKGEAIVVFLHVYAKEVAQAKIVARILAEKQGTVTSREVINFMIAEGTFVVTETSKEHWISSIWDEKVHGKRVWEWTGERRWEKSTKTQGGKPYNMVWRLKK